ncbi:S9 family peptidase [Enhygromyxa salina]|nr:S9 family peptidase [Enhygromyxa salina]
MSDHTGVPNVYEQPLAGGELVPLTTGDEVSKYAVSYFPKDERFLFAADGGGDELNHLFVGEKGKEAIDITPGEGFRADFGNWTADKSGFFVSSNERDPKSFDIYLYDAKTLERKMIFKNEGGVLPAAIDPNLRWLAVDKLVDNADSNIYLIDLHKKKPKQVLITEHAGKVELRASHFSRDGKTLYYSTNEHSEWDQFWAYDIAKKTHAEVLKADWDVLFFKDSEHDKYRVSLVNQDARGKLTITERASGETVDIPGLPPGNIEEASFSPSETKLVLHMSTDRTPTDLYLYDLEAKTLKQLSDTLNPQIDAEQLVNAEVLRFESYDGVQVPSILWKPREASAENKVPVMLWIHGGPGGQTWAAYRPTIQYLVNQGYAIFAVNNRGSSGYGKTFYHLDDRKHGDADLDDCVAAKAYLQGLDWVDTDSIGIMGGSYGGYMTLAALAFRPDEFKVGIDIFGVANWIRTLESIPPWWDAFRASLYAEIGDPKADRERLEAHSPLLHADKITKPLLVIQGANDPRVLRAESDEIVEAVKKKGVPVEYVIFDDEGHGFAKRENAIKADEAMKNFLDAHLRGS